MGQLGARLSIMDIRPRSENEDMVGCERGAGGYGLGAREFAHRKAMMEFTSRNSYGGSPKSDMNDTKSEWGISW